MKELRLLKNYEKDIVMEYIARNPLETTFLYANVLRFGIENNPELRRSGDYYGFFVDSNLKGILPFYNLGSCIPHFEDEDAIDYFVNEIKKRDFSYLLGMSKYIKPIYESIKDTKNVLECSDDSYYVNENYKPFVLKNVEIKNVKDIEIDKAVEFLQEASQKGFGRVESKEETIKSIKEKGDEEDFIFVIDNGNIVAQANIQTFTDKIKQVGGVYTSEEYRGKGYCKAAVSEICRRIVLKGMIPTLMVRKNNIPAVKAYGALGFKHYDDYMIIKIGVGE